MKGFTIEIWIVFVLFVFVGPCIFCACQEDNSVAPMEKKEQEALYSAIQGFVGKWWNGSDLYPDPCGWTPIQGVSCDLQNGLWYVTSLNLGPVYDNSLECNPNAAFSHHLFQLKHLKSLSFFNCFNLSRPKPLPIPTSNWEKLSNTLESLEFRSNPGLVGAIPASFGSLKALQSLVLLDNGVTGRLPAEMGGLINLKRLVLAGNRFMGRIPATWGKLDKLLILDLSRNSLSGSLPFTFRDLTSLMKLDLSRNNLEGELPIQIGNLKNLTVLDLSHNSFSGGLPLSLHEMLSLDEMVLSDNPIGGDLTRIRWENLQNLEFLDLSDMGLTGEIPDSMTRMKRLRFLGLIRNNLSGTVSLRFESMPCISSLFLHGNNLTGRLEFSESFYRRMGSRFRASGNPDLCFPVGLTAAAASSSHGPSGLKACREDRSNVPDGERVTKISDGYLNAGSYFVASMGFSISGFDGFLWVCKASEIAIVLTWIMLW